MHSGTLTVENFLRSDHFSSDYVAFSKMIKMIPGIFTAIKIPTDVYFTCLSQVPDNYIVGSKKRLRLNKYERA